MVERARPDFRQVLSRSTLSISQAGYNTVVDLLRAGTRAVLVPFEAGHETEQRLRAERLQARGLARVIPEADLSTEHLVETVRAALLDPPPASHTVRLDGAERSVELIASLPGPRTGRRSYDWSALDQAFRRAGDTGTPLNLWWRDDDAVADTPALRRLLALSRHYRAPVALAVVPQALDPSLASILGAEDETCALVHGYAHANHAPPGEKKAEFGAHRPLPVRAEEAAAGLEVSRAALGSKLLPVFVPPWNRVAPDLLSALREAGYHAISTFGDRAAREPVAGLLQINAHVDPIDWHGSRSLREPAQVIGQFAAAVQRRIGSGIDEPVGLLTHHLVHDEAIWSFCEALLERIERNNVRFSLAATLFCDKNRIAVER
jgi:hypothetical protein